MIPLFSKLNKQFTECDMEDSIVTHLSENSEQEQQEGILPSTDTFPSERQEKEERMKLRRRSQIKVSGPIGALCILKASLFSVQHRF